VIVFHTLFSCCHSGPTSLVSESVEDAMIPVAFDDEEEAEFCSEDIAARAHYPLLPFFTQLNHSRDCYMSASVQFLEASVMIFMHKNFWRNGKTAETTGMAMCQQGRA